MGLSEITIEIIYLREALLYLKFTNRIDECTIIYIDYLSVVHFGRNAVNHCMSKNICRGYFIK